MNAMQSNIEYFVSENIMRELSHSEIKEAAL